MKKPDYIKNYSRNIIILFLAIFLYGCFSTTGNVGHMQSYPFVSAEADWIKNGEPIEFEGELWYPADDVEVLRDSEVYVKGEYKGVQFFVEKIDVRPYNRLYTKFGKNEFRFYEKRDDK